MQPDYQILPKRSAKQVGSKRNDLKIEFCTNYYDIDIALDKMAIYQYSFSLPQGIPNDSGLYNKAILSIKDILKEKIGYISHSGQMLWGRIQLKTHCTNLCSFKVGQNQYKLQSVIKVVKSLNFEDLNTGEHRDRYLQILNVNIKNTLMDLKLNELGKSRLYFQKQTVNSPDLAKQNLSVVQGFRFTLVPLNNRCFLQIDTCTRVLQSKKLIQMFAQKSEKEIKQAFIGKTVITRYGIFKTYKIEQVDFTKNPKSKFYNQKKGVETTYQEYYAEAYGTKIQNMNQPLLLVVTHIQKVIKKDTKNIQEVKHFAYLLPQLVSITGLTNEQRADYGTMKLLDPYTKLSPTDRVKRCAGIIEKFNKANKQIRVKGVKKLQGYYLERPKLHYSGKSVTADQGGIIKYRGALKQRCQLENWLFVYSQSGNRDYNQASEAVQCLIKAAKQYGVQISQPGYINSDMKYWKDQIRDDIKNNGAPKIVVFFVKNFEEKEYGDIKKFATNQLKCPSQFIRKRTLISSKNPMSAASKIVIQMNIKTGYAPWQVERNHPAFKDKNLVYGALSLSQGQNGTTLAFVGTTNNQCSKIYSSCKYGLKSKQNIPVADLEQIFLNWVSKYHQINKKAPNLIILYRQGLSIPQVASQVTKMQIPALQNMMKKFGQTKKIQNYEPQIVIITANKSINSRFYKLERQQKDNSLAPLLRNVDSGSIITQPLSIDDSYDFHLAAQYVTQGTCTPTLFRIVYDTSNLPSAALETFTYEQCFNYYNWQGAVRVPAALQCADKLSKLVSMSIKTNIQPSSISNQHYFL